MNDRELLELAAKAAGYDGLGSWYENAMWDGEGWHWNPLTDDGDAFRLAVDLVLGIGFPREGYVWSFGRNGKVCAEMTDDPYAATRRAIVRAAAEIAKQQEQPR